MTDKILVYGVIHPEGYIKPEPKPNKERENGFYWVKDNGDWYVCLWTGVWQFPGSEWDYQDEAFEEIIEEIIPEPKNKTINV